MVLSGNQVVEYVEETQFGTTPTNPAMQWVGLIEKFEPKIAEVIKQTRYLGADGVTDKLALINTVKIREDLETKLEFVAQDLTFWSKYGLGSATGTAEDLPSISIGEIIDVGGTKNYGLFKGCKVKSITLSFEEDEPAKVSADLIMSDFSGYGTTDYIGTGSHASENAATPLKWDDISNVQYGGLAFSDYIRSLEISVSYEMKVIRDVGATTSTGIVELKPTSRDIKVKLTMDLDSLSMINEVRNATPKDLVVTVGANTITIKDVVFPEVTKPLTPDDLIEHEFESALATAITIA